MKDLETMQREGRNLPNVKVKYVEGYKSSDEIELEAVYKSDLDQHTANVWKAAYKAGQADYSQALEDKGMAQL